MSLLPAGQPLKNFVEDFDALLYDAEGYLRAERIVVGPRSMYGLVALFGLPGLAILFYWLTTDRTDSDPLITSIGLLIGAGIWMLWSLMLVGHRVVLHPDGVEFHYKQTTVWCPWAVFRAGGAPFVANSDSPLVGLSLPVDPDAVPYIELRQDEQVLAYGRQIQAKQFHFAASDVVVLPARYEMRAEDLGALILAVGSRLGGELPKETPPREAFVGSDYDPVLDMKPDHEGWMTIHLAKLDWPDRCCSCLQETDEKSPVYTSSRIGWFVSLARPQAEAIEIMIPLCESCREEHFESHRRATRWGLNLGALGALVLFMAFAWQRLPGRIYVLLGSIASVAAGSVVGSIIGSAMGNRPPVRFRRFSASTSTVQIKFVNPEYANVITDHLESLERRGR